MTDKNSGQQPVKTKEEVLKSLHIYRGFSFDYDGMLKAMEEYASVREGQQSAYREALETIKKVAERTMISSNPHEYVQITYRFLEIATEALSSPVPSKEQSEGEKKYYDGLTRRYGRTPEYQFTGDKCVPGCKNFSHYEAKHHPDCPFYPGSLSEKYDKIDASKEQGEERRMGLEKENELLEAREIAWCQKVEHLQQEIERLRKELDDCRDR